MIYQLQVPVKSTRLGMWTATSSVINVHENLIENSSIFGSMLQIETNIVDTALITLPLTP